MFQLDEKGALVYFVVISISQHLLGMNILLLFLL